MRRQQRWLPGSHCRRSTGVQRRAQASVWAGLHLQQLAKFQQRCCPRMECGRWSLRSRLPARGASPMTCMLPCPLQATSDVMIVLSILVG